MADPKNLAIDERAYWFLGQARKKYDTDFIGFYVSLSGRQIGKTAEYKGEKYTDAYSFKKQRDRVKQISNTLGEILKSYEAIPSELIQKLFESMSIVEAELREIREFSTTDAALSEDLNAVYRLRGISIESLLNDQKLIQSRLQASLKPARKSLKSLKAKLAGISPTAYGLAAGIGLEFVRALGPAGFLGEKAFKIGSEIMEFRRRRKETLETRAAVKAITPEKERTPESLRRMFERFEFGGREPTELERFLEKA